MARRRHKNHLKLILLVILAILLVSFFILKASNFNEVNFLLRNKPIPDVVVIPKDVLKSIENVKPQKTLKVPILLGIKIISFAYPSGAFDNTVIDVVQKAGFKTAVTTISGTYVMDINRFFLNRIRPGGLAGQALLNLLENTE